MRAVWLWVIAGCHSDPERSTEPTEPTDPSAVTFTRDLRPLLADGCERCHGDDHLGPGDFGDYDTVAAWAEIMLERIDAGEMPPPAADPACHPYRGAEAFAIDPALRDTLAAWIDAGKLPGDPSAPAPEPWSPGTLPRRDVELGPAAPIAPQYVDGNEYRCFLVDTVEADTFVTGIEFVADHGEISHHAVLFVDPDGGSQRSVVDAPTQSWPCPQVVPEPNWQMLHAWAPGGEAVEFAPGQGIRLGARSQLVLQMHYFQSTAEPIEDRPAYGLMLADAVDDELLYVGLGPEDFVVPAGEPAYTATAEYPMQWLTYGQFDIDVYGVMPHMHVLGTGYDFGSSDACISRSDGYDFAMQPTYWFDAPVRIGRDETLTVSCTYDNSSGNPRQLSDPPTDVTWGENTQQEMCYALMYLALRP